MPRGQRFDGKWNFHTKRYLCENCGKKGLYVSARLWIKCMYCKIFITPDSIGHSERIKQIKNGKTEK